MRKISIVLLSTCILFFACQKEHLSTINSIVEPDFENLKIIDGRLQFSDDIQFNKILDWIYEHQNDEERIVAAFANIGLKKSFNTLNTQMDKMTSAEEAALFAAEYPKAFLPIEYDNSIIYEMQSPLTTSYFTNESGLYQIGDVVYRVTFDIEYSMDLSQYSDLTLLLSPSSESNGKISVNTILQNNDKAQYSYRTSYFDSKRRIVARLYLYKPHSCSVEWDARVTSQKKTAGIWFYKDIDNINLSWEEDQLYYRVDGRLKDDDINDRNYNKANSSNLRKTIWEKHFGSASPFSPPSYSCSFNMPGGFEVKHKGTNNGTTKTIVNFPF